MHFVYQVTLSLCQVCLSERCLLRCVYCQVACSSFVDFVLVLLLWYKLGQSVCTCAHWYASICICFGACVRVCMCLSACPVCFVSLQSADKNTTPAQLFFPCPVSLAPLPLILVLSHSIHLSRALFSILSSGSSDSPHLPLLSHYLNRIYIIRLRGALDTLLPPNPAFCWYQNSKHHIVKWYPDCHMAC